MTSKKPTRDNSKAEIRKPFIIRLLYKIYSLTKLVAESTPPDQLHAYEMHMYSRRLAPSHQIVELYPQSGWRSVP